VEKKKSIVGDPLAHSKLLRSAADPTRIRDGLNEVPASCQKKGGKEKSENTSLGGYILRKKDLPNFIQGGDVYQEEFGRELIRERGDETSREKKMREIYISSKKPTRHATKGDKNG